jgi:hypothetical protein
MGEWSEYFEQFPEENPANQRNNGDDLGPMSEFFPHLHIGQLTKAERAEVEAKINELNAESERLAKEQADFIEGAKSQPIYREDSCPICRIKAMNIYKVSDTSFYCECQNCNVSGDGDDIPKIFEKMEDDIWNIEY